LKQKRAKQRAKGKEEKEEEAKRKSLFCVCVCVFVIHVCVFLSKLVRVLNLSKANSQLNSDDICPSPFPYSFLSYVCKR